MTNLTTNTTNTLRIRHNHFMTKHARISEILKGRGSYVVLYPIFYDLVFPAGIEPTTYCVGDSHSILLSYGNILKFLPSPEISFTLSFQEILHLTSSLLHITDYFKSTDSILGNSEE